MIGWEEEGWGLDGDDGMGWDVWDGKKIWIWMDKGGEGTCFQDMTSILVCSQKKKKNKKKLMVDHQDVIRYDTIRKVKSQKPKKGTTSPKRTPPREARPKGEVQVRKARKQLVQRDPSGVVEGEEIHTVKNKIKRVDGWIM
jgi:hypothetical protein